MRILVLGLTAVISFSSNGSASGQVVATSLAQRSTGTVSVTFDGVLLKDALQTLSRQSNVHFTYGEDVINMKSRVTYKADEVPVQNALTAILRGTGITYRYSRNGDVILERTKQVGKAHGVVIGKITDARTGKGVSGASVSVGNNGQSVLSGEDGVYRLAAVPAGTQIVSVRLVGYAKQTRSIIIGEGASVTADFKLEPSANVLDQVVVTGTVASTELKAVPNAITVITAKQLEERGITRIDQLFRGDVPGLFALNMGSQNVLDEVVMFSRGATALRGSSGGSVGSQGINNNIGVLAGTIKTYIDGVEMADSKYLSQIDPASIERIEILTGPQASTVYGANAINGVMQIFTKRGNRSSPQVGLNFSSGFTQNNMSSRVAPTYVTDANAMGMEGRLSYSAGGFWNYEGAWTPGKQGQRSGVNGGLKADAGKRATVDVTARSNTMKNRQRGSLQHGMTALYQTGVYLPSSSPGIVIPLKQELTTTTYGINVTHQPFSWWSHTVGVGSDNYKNQSAYTGYQYSGPSDSTLIFNQSNSTRLSERYSATLQIPLQSLARLDLSMGSDHWKARTSSLTGSGNSLNGSLSFPGVTRGHPIKNTGAFAQGQLGIKDALFFTYGVRADWNESFGDKAKVRPGRYGVSYTRDIGSVSAKFRGSYGKSIRPPGEGYELAVPISSTDTWAIRTFSEYNTQLANPYLGPESQQGGEGGVELYFGSRGSLVVTRYNQTVNDLISSVPKVDSVRSVIVPVDFFEVIACGSEYRDSDNHCFAYQNQVLNVGSIRNDGWELQGSANIGPFITNGTYSWTKSRIIGITPRYRALLNDASYRVGGSFGYLPEHTWAWTTTYTNPQGYLGLTFNGIGRRLVSLDELHLLTESSLRFRYLSPRLTSLGGYPSQGNRYLSASMNGSYRFRPNVDATLNVSNLANTYNIDYSARTAVAGRTTRMGLRIRL